MCAMVAQLELALGGSIQEPLGRKRGRPWSTQGSSRGEEERMLQLLMGSVERPDSALLGKDLQQQPAAPSPGSCTLLRELLREGKTQRCGTSEVMNVMRLIQQSEEGAGASTTALELDSEISVPLPAGWEKCLDLQTGSIYFLNRGSGVSTACDPRVKPPASASRQHVVASHWPTSPSSSSDLTFEYVQAEINATGMSSHEQQQPVAASHGEPNGLVEDKYLDLTLSLSLNYGGSNHTHSCPRPQPSTSLLSKADSHLITGLIRFNKATTSAPPAPQLARGNHPMPSPPSEAATQPRMMPLNSLHSDDAAVPFDASRQLTPSSSMVPAHSSSRNSPHMITLACANCLMFVMLPHSSHPQCPRCGASIEAASQQQREPQYPLLSKKSKLDAARILPLFS